MTPLTIALLGSTGFVGSAVRAALEEDHQIKLVSAPRLRTSARNVRALLDEARKSAAAAALTPALQGVDVVINAAGDPDASSMDADGLFGANALLPRVVAEAAAAAQVPRLVHVSSAVVQNDRPVLDESEEMFPFSPYSESKVFGELVLKEDLPPGLAVTRFRPPSVHAPSRRVTVRIAKIARSPLASVAKPGDQPSPQALLANVAAAVAFLVTSEQVPPPVVIHPWEGLTAQGLMQLLGNGRQPRKIPRPLAKALVGGARVLGRHLGSVAANARRAELLWLGQDQSRSWLTEQGWKPPAGPMAWKELSTLVESHPTGGESR